MVRVLLVEDDEDDYFLFRDALDQYPSLFELRWVTSYPLALETINQETFDTCVIDFHLGEKSGLELVKALTLKGFPGPLIILTGLGYQAGIDEKAMSVGADDYLAKQEITPPLLKRTILFNIQRKTNETRYRLSEAGFRQMAEISTSTLHNIGNVLNHLSISSQTTETLLKQIDPTRLGDVARLVQEKLKDSDNDRGELIAQYLLKIRDNISNGIQRVDESVKSSLEKLKLAESAIAIQQGTMRRGAREEISLKELIRETLTLNRVSILRQGIEWTINDPKDVCCKFSRGTLLHIVINLVKNALEAMEGCPRKLLSFNLDEKDHQVIVQIRDSGVGIDPAIVTKLFAHGFTTKPNGHGFGLHFCRQVLEKEGGSIFVTSQPGEGTQFEIRLPK